jgi:hypothetical protein
MMQNKLIVIEGDGDKHREEVGKKMVSAILTRNDLEFDKLHRTLHTPVLLTLMKCRQKTKN